MQCLSIAHGMVKELICIEGAVGNKLSHVCGAVIPGKGGSHGSVMGGICHKVRSLDGTWGNRAHQLGSRWLTGGWVFLNSERPTLITIIFTIILHNDDSHHLDFKFQNSISKVDIDYKVSQTQ